MHFLVVKLSNVELWKHHEVSPLQTNCFVFSRGKSCIMLDPGGPEAVNIASNLFKRGYAIKHILITHGHFDHTGWAGEVKKLSTDAKIYVNVEEQHALRDFDTWGKVFGLPPIPPYEVDVWFEKDQILELDGFVIKTIHCPGHTPGSTIYYFEDSKLAFTGDVLFKLSIGRTDFPYSDTHLMNNSLKKIVDTLDDEVGFWPGHGPPSTIGFEKNHNPFLSNFR